jgi:hypothetical protein
MYDVERIDTMTDMKALVNAANTVYGDKENTDKKYVLSDETIEYGDNKKYAFHRIKALKSFNCGDRFVKAGDLGGFVECEENLSQDGNCWIFDNAMCFFGASVRDDAMVYEDAKISGNSEVYNNAKVFGAAEVSGLAEVYDNAMVYCNAIVCGAEVHDDARVYGNASIYNVEVVSSTCICGNASIHAKGR